MRRVLPDLIGPLRRSVVELPCDRSGSDSHSLSRENVTPPQFEHAGSGGPTSLTVSSSTTAAKGVPQSSHVTMRRSFTMVSVVISVLRIPVRLDAE